MREGVEDDAVSEERHLVQALLAQHEGDLAAVGRQLGLTHEELSELLTAFTCAFAWCSKAWTTRSRALGQAGTLFAFRRCGTAFPRSKRSDS